MSIPIKKKLSKADLDLLKSTRIRLSEINESIILLRRRENDLQKQLVEVQNKCKHETNYNKSLSCLVCGMWMGDD